MERESRRQLGRVRAGAATPGTLQIPSSAGLGGGWRAYSSVSLGFYAISAGIRRFAFFLPGASYIQCIWTTTVSRRCRGSLAQIQTKAEKKYSLDA